MYVGSLLFYQLWFDVGKDRYTAIGFPRKEFLQLWFDVGKRQIYSEVGLRGAKAGVVV